MSTSGDLKSGGSLFFFTTLPTEFQWTSSPPPPAPNGNDLGHALYEVLHELHTIKI